MSEMVPAPSGDKDGFAVVVSRWGLAAIVAGLESLLEHDASMRIEQRLSVSGMVGEFRKVLGSSIPEVVEA